MFLTASVVLVVLTGELIFFLFQLLSIFGRGTVAKLITFVATCCWRWLHLRASVVAACILAFWHTGILASMHRGCLASWHPLCYLNRNAVAVQMKGSGQHLMHIYFDCHVYNACGKVKRSVPAYGYCGYLQMPWNSLYMPPTPSE